MMLRLRSRDGLERVMVENPHATTVLGLKRLIEAQLRIPVQNQTLSTNQNLLLAKSREDLHRFTDMANPDVTLSSLNLAHGSIVFLTYEGERHVAGPAFNPAGSFGRKMTMDDLIAKQMRVTRQENPHCELVSFDRDCANAFQHYVNDTLAFAVKRGGFMYGNVSEEGKVEVDFIYEPPQQGSEENLLFFRDPEEEKLVEAIAAGLGMRRVGFIFTQTISQDKKDYTLSNREVLQAAEYHAESGPIGTTTLSDTGRSTTEEGVSATSHDKEADGDQIMTVVENLHTRPSLEDANKDQILTTEEDVDIQSNPGGSDVVRESFIRPEDSSTLVPPKVNGGIKKPNEVIELDSPESPKGDENETIRTVDQTDRQNINEVGATTEHATSVATSTDDNHSADDISEAGKFSQNHSKDAKTTSARQQSHHDAAAIAQRKLTAYMEQNHIESRSEVRRLNPALWREFLVATLPLPFELTACRMCFARNDGHNQRFNSTVLCVRCLEEALQMLKDQNEHQEEAEEIV